MTMGKIVSRHSPVVTAASNVNTILRLCDILPDRTLDGLSMAPDGWRASHELVTDKGAAPRDVTRGDQEINSQSGVALHHRSHRTPENAKVIGLTVY